MGERKGESMSGFLHEGCFEPTKTVKFPLVRDEIKKAHKSLSDAVWEDDQTLIERMTRRISYLEKLLSHGEEYDIPF